MNHPLVSLLADCRVLAPSASISSAMAFASTYPESARLDPLPLDEEAWSLRVLESKESTRLRRIVRLSAELLFQRAECRGCAGMPSTKKNPESVQHQSLDAQLMDALDDLTSQSLQMVASLALQVLVDRSEI